MNASSPQAGSIAGQTFFLWFALLLGIAMAATLALTPDLVEGVRLVIRVTARISLVLFLGAFLAASLAQLWSGGLTHWLRANRRWLGLSFAWSHFVHAVAILALVRLDAALFWTLSNPVSVAGGSLAYLFIAALAATSFDRMVVALGPRRWSLLHRTGTWIIWLVFLISNAKRIPGSAWYALPCAILIAALLLRQFAPRIVRRTSRTA